MLILSDGTFVDKKEIIFVINNYIHAHRMFGVT